jgi:hypothetical protein
MLRNRRFQFAISEILQLAVDRQREIAAFDRLADVRGVLDDAAEPILDHAPAAGLACEPILVRELDAFLPAIVHVRDADQMRSQIAGRIVAAVFALQRDSRQSQLHDFLG